jgi:hypothetical protein
MIFCCVFVGVLPVPSATGFPQNAALSPEGPAFGDFSQRVEQYLKL